MGVFVKSKRFAWLVAAGLLVAACGGGDTEADQDRGSGARENGDDERREDAAAKVESQLIEIEREAVKAIDRRDWPLARKLLGDGLGLAKRSGHEFELNRAGLLLSLGDVERESGKEVDARRYYADAMAVYRVQGSGKGRFKVHLSQGDLEAALGDYSAATREYAAAEALLGEVDDRPLEGEFKMRIGRLASRQMRHEDAIAAFAEAAKIFDIVKQPRDRAEALLALAGEEDNLDKETNCRRALDKALSIFRDIGDKEGEVRALHKAAALAERAKRYKKARSLLKKVRELYLALDRQSDAAKVLQHLSSLPE